jgi:hypothetical protein
MDRPDQGWLGSLEHSRMHRWVVSDSEVLIASL